MDKQSTAKAQTNRTRRQTYIIPKRTFPQRYPLTTIWSATIAGLAIFFSRPIYDAFIRTDVTSDIPADQRKEIMIKAWRI